MTVLALTHHTGIRLAELGFLLFVFGGLWLVAARIPGFKLGETRTFIAGVAVAIGGVLIIIAIHWGHFA